MLPAPVSKTLHFHAVSLQEEIHLEGRVSLPTLLFMFY